MTPLNRLSLVPLMLGGALLLSTIGCGDADVRNEPLDDSQIWGETGDQVNVSDPVAFVKREDGLAYGLPRPGERGIADLIARMDAEPTGFDEPDLFVAPGIDPPTDQCRGGDVTTFQELPMTLEVVVTLYPRRYMKPQICGQDERHYGNFTVTDDTGGMIVLRDSRVAPYTYGDRLRLTVRGVGRTFGATDDSKDTRVIVIADIEKLPTPPTSILYTEQEGPFGLDDVGQVRRVQGWVEQAPTNDNFNTMLITSAPVEPIEYNERLTGSLLQCVRTCEVDSNCPSVCPRTDDANPCAELCLGRCYRALEAEPDRNVNTLVDEIVAGLPACWVVSLDSELGRRGYTARAGQQIEAIGPVVHDFDRKIWVASPGQFTILE
ncbi:MAG: hypothetical protein AAFS10_07965 [Myxococcota bacterium]